MGAPHREQDNGAVYVAYGPAEQGATVADADLVYYPSFEHSRFGDSVSLVDINEDGELDLIVTAPDAAVEFANQGAVLIEYGPLTADYFDQLYLGEDADVQLGSAVVSSTAGLFVGAHQVDQGTGEVFLLEW